MSVLENIQYGLKVSREDPGVIEEESARIITLLNLEGLEDRPVAALSGGQQQRVAIGRAVIVRPAVLLFDEPLSNLDENLRDRMRREIKQILNEVGITSIYVTHDQNEAMTMADRVVVMKGGRIEQIAPPAELYYRPQSVYVASFLGYRNLFPADFIRRQSMTLPEGLDPDLCNTPCSSRGYKDISPGGLQRKTGDPGDDDFGMRDRRRSAHKPL